jgi:diguanylate cyclase (GGDEF)-like protein/PAS domain S-box-containing protein
VFAAISDAVLVTDLGGIVVDCNPAAEAMYGLSREKLLGRMPGAERDSMEAGERVARVLKTVGREGRWTGDLPLVRSDGTHRVTATTVVGIYDDDGGLVGMAGFRRDVTDERQIAARLAAAEQRWRLTLDGAPSGIALVSLEGRFVRVNQALCAMVGYSEEQLLARTFQDITHPEDLDADLSLLAQLIAGEISSYTMEKRYFHARGHPVWISLSVGLVRDPRDDQPLHFVSQMQDVTARRGAASRLASIIASASEAFIGIDTAGTVTEWNAAAEATFGWERSAAVGQPLHVLIIPAERRAEHLRGLARLAAGCASHLLDGRIEVTACSRTGRRFPVELTIWRADEAAGEFYAFVRDISTRVRAEEQGKADAKRQTALVEAQRTIADIELTPTKVMQHICDFAQQLTGAESAVIELRTSTAFMTCSAATADLAQHIGKQVAVDASITGLAAESGEALICDDCATDPRVDTEACREVGVRSMVVVPLRRDGAVVGVLEVLSSLPGQFNAADKATLELLASPFGAAISNANRMETTSRQALTDPLTGLANRSEALHELDRALARQARHGGDVAVLFIDLDGFKTINDNLGHRAGDEALIAVGVRLRAAVRTTDIPARYGGDEFVIICEAIAQPLDVDVLAARLIATLPGEYHLAEGIAQIGTSIGVALARMPVPAEQLLRAADDAMYEAKRAGGNRYVSRVVRPVGDRTPN